MPGTTLLARQLGLPAVYSGCARSPAVTFHRWGYLTLVLLIVTMLRTPGARARPGPHL